LARDFRHRIVLGFREDFGSTGTLACALLAKYGVTTARKLRKPHRQECLCYFFRGLFSLSGFDLCEVKQNCNLGQEVNQEEAKRKNLRAKKSKEDRLPFKKLRVKSLSYFIRGRTQ